METRIGNVGVATGIDTSRLRTLLDVSRERDYQDRLHPMPDGFPASLRMAILAEEVGEVAAEVISMHLPKPYPADHAKLLRAELVQVAAVAVRWIEALDKAEASDE